MIAGQRKRPGSGAHDMSFEFPKLFDPQPSLENETLLLRPLAAADQTALAKAASDRRIWEGHPAKDRYLAEVFAGYFEALLDIGGCLLITDKAEGAVIGCSAYYTDRNAPQRLSIGFTFLTCAHWGGPTNRALKRLMLSHIYEHAPEAWFHIAPDNYRSQAATKKLGAVLTHEDQMDLGGGAQLWQCYCLTREAWDTSLSTHDSGRS